METIVFGKNWEFRNHLELVKESEAWDGGLQPGKKLGFKAVVNRKYPRIPVFIYFR